MLEGPGRSQHQAVAVALGTLWAWAVLTCGNTNQSSQMAFYNVVNSCELILAEPPTDTACPDIVRGLAVALEAGHRTEPLIAAVVGEGKQTLFAEFSGSWAERRSVFLVIRPKGLVLVQVAFSTDYGNYLGEIDSSNSSVHRHDETICIDLRVERLDGRETIERWIARIAL